jgi:hypothetical protein
LDPESEQIREVYALYGLAMYMAQNLERGLSMLLASSGDVERTTAWDYDARLAENFTLTFGDLVSKFKDHYRYSHSQIVLLDRAVDMRNDLAHHYFWDRAVEFATADGRDQMIAELCGMRELFESLDNELETLTREQVKRRGLSPDFLENKTKEHLERVLAGIQNFHDPDLPPNPVEIVGAYEWRLGTAVKCGLVLKSRDGKLLILGEKGLCYGPQNIPEQDLIKKVEFDVALPVAVNPRVKKASPWNFGIPLANGYVLRVRPDEVQGKAVVRFGLRKSIKSRELQFKKYV